MKLKKAKPGVQEIAAAAAVSIATVSRVVNGTTRVGPAVEERVRAAATALGIDLSQRNRTKSLVFLLSNRAMLHSFAEQTYCVIAFVPNLSRNGNVLMIAGATREGTEAAGEYITNPRLTLQMLKRIHALDNGHVRYFEVLLKSGTIAGTSKNADVVAYRLLS